MHACLQSGQKSGTLTYRVFVRILCCKLIYVKIKFRGKFKKIQQKVAFFILRSYVIYKSFFTLCVTDATPTIWMDCPNSGTNYYRIMKKTLGALFGISLRKVSNNFINKEYISKITNIADDQKPGSPKFYWFRRYSLPFLHWKSQINQHGETEKVLLTALSVKSCIHSMAIVARDRECKNKRAFSFAHSRPAIKWYELWWVAPGTNPQED
jgi:hypothetical protein